MKNVLLHKITIIFVTLLTLFFLNSSYAKMPSDAVKIAKQRVEEFKSVRKELGGALPKFGTRLGDPVLQRLYDKSAILGEEPYTADDIEKIRGVRNAMADVLDVYMQLTLNNSYEESNLKQLEYQRELAVSMSFVMQMSKVFTLSTADDQFKTESRIRTRKVLSTFLPLVVFYALNPKLSKESQAIYWQSIRDNLPILAASLSKPQRVEFVSVMKKISILDEEHRKVVSDIILSLPTMPCEGLCALKED